MQYAEPQPRTAILRVSEDYQPFTVLLWLTDDHIRSPYQFIGLPYGGMQDLPQEENDLRNTV